MSKIKKKIKEKDFVYCVGIGYPHWFRHVFQVKNIAPDGDFILSNNIRVSSKDFRLYECDEDTKLKIMFHLETEKFYLPIEDRKHPKFVNPVWFMDSQLLSKIQDAFSYSNIRSLFATDKNILMLTDEHLIFVNSNHESEDWGRRNGKHNHVFIKFEDINTTISRRNIVTIHDANYEFSFKIISNSGNDIQETNRFLSELNESRNKRDNSSFWNDYRNVNIGL